MPSADDRPWYDVLSAEQEAADHPVRLRIIDLMSTGERMSPKEASEALDVSLGTVSYHFRMLANLKMVRIVKKVPRRGAVEHYYVLTQYAQPILARIEQHKPVEEVLSPPS